MSIFIDAKDRAEATDKAAKVVNAVTRGGLPIPSFMMSEIGDRSVLEEVRPLLKRMITEGNTQAERALASVEFALNAK